MLQVIDYNERYFKAKLFGQIQRFEIKKFRLATEREIKLNEIKNIF